MHAPDTTAFALLMCLVLVALVYGRWPPLAAALLLGDGDPPPAKRKEVKPWESLLQFGKSSSSAPKADPAVGQAALKSAQTGEDWLKYAQEQADVYNKRQESTDALAATVQNQQLDTSKQQAQWAQEDRARYTGQFQPLQDDYIEKAKDWDSPDRQATLATEARADVLNNAAASKQASQRGAAAMGIDPTSGRYAGIDRTADVATGLAAAGAENNARSQVRQQGLALQESAINLGNGLPASASTAAGMGVSAGSASLGTNLAANQSSLAGTQIMGQGYQGAMSGYNSQAQILGQQQQQKQSAWQANQAASASSSAATGQALGAAAGIALMFM